MSPARRNPRARSTQTLRRRRLLAAMARTGRLASRVIATAAPATTSPRRSRCWRPTAVVTPVRGPRGPVLERGAGRRQRLNARRVDQRMIRRERADGIRRGRVARQMERLAAAAPEVGGPAVAAPARLRHPRLAAVRVEGIRIDARSRRAAGPGRGRRTAPASVCAAWQGRTSPSGLITMNRRPQPSMHDFGNSA